MIVCVLGMQRSGSTFSFNVVRDTLLRRGSLYQEATIDLGGALARAESIGADHLLLKAHAANDLLLRLIKLGAVRAVCTVRRPDDAIASWMVTFGFRLEESIEAMRNWLALYSRIRTMAVVIPYDEVDLHPIAASWKIARAVDPFVSPLEVIRVARRYSKAAVKTSAEKINVDDAGVKDVGFSYYDESSFFHRRHVNSLMSRRAEDLLPPQQLAQIRNALRADVASIGDPLLAFPKA